MVIEQFEPSDALDIASRLPADTRVVVVSGAFEGRLGTVTGLQWSVDRPYTVRLDGETIECNLLPSQVRTVASLTPHCDLDADDYAKHRLAAARFLGGAEERAHAAELGWEG